MPPPPTVTNSPTPPLAPAEGDLWFNTTTGREYVWYTSPSSGVGSWVQTQPTSTAVVTPHAVPPTPVSPPAPGPNDVSRTPTQTVSEVPPTSPAPVPGDLWWNTRSGQEFIYYDDGNTVQWVLANKGNGLAGDNGDDAFTRTTADFVVPAVGANVAVNVNDTSFYKTGQSIYVEGSGYYTAALVLPTTKQVVLTNVTANPDDTVTSGAALLIAGLQGIQGPPGIVQTITSPDGSITIAGTPTNPTISANLGFFNGHYVQKTGDTMSGALTLAYGGPDAGVLVNQTDAAGTGGRAGYYLQKAGVLAWAVQTDADGHGENYYQGWGSNATHQFFINNTLVASLLPSGWYVNGGLQATGPLVVGNNAAIQHDFKQANNSELAIYSDTANEVVIDAFAATDPLTKYSINLGKYGGIVNVNNAKAVAPVATSNDNSVVTSAWVVGQGYALISSLAGYLPLTGGTLTGDLVMSGTKSVFLGGTGAAHPKLSNRQSTIVDCMLGDESDWAPFRSGTLTTMGNRITSPAGAQFFFGTSNILVRDGVNGPAGVVLGDVTAPVAGGSTVMAYKASNIPNFGVLFGTGPYTVAAAKGSLGLDNGGGAPWYNKDGTATGWVQLGAGGASIWVGTAAPVGPTPGMLWWYTDASTGGGQLYIYYDDGTSQQWVPAAAGAGAAQPSRTYDEYAAATVLTAQISTVDTIPLATAGTNILSRTVTVAAGQRVHARFQGWVGSSANNTASAILTRSGSANALRVTAASFPAGYATGIFLEYEDSPGAGTFTYGINVGPNSGTGVAMNGNPGRIFGGAAAATLTLEIF